MKLQFCACRHCTYGRNRGGHPEMITKVKRKARRLVKAELKNAVKNGDWYVNPPEKISVPYCD